MTLTTQENPRNGLSALHGLYNNNSSNIYLKKKESRGDFREWLII